MLHAQDTMQLQLLKSIDLKAHFIETDRMQQVYVVTNNHSLQKYSADGELLKIYNENGLGAISTVDVTNPLQILVYFADYQTAVILDRSLSELYRFRLGDLDLMQIEAVALSSDNRLWLYDANNFLLKKIDNNGNIELESPDLSGILTDAFLPKRLFEAEYKIFLNDPDFGIMLFDNFGNYIQMLQIRGLDYFQIFNGHLIWLDEKKRLHRFHLRNFREEETDLKALGIETEGLLQLCLSPDRLLLRYADRVLWYNWN